MTTYQNPVIPGFYPDPSVCRVGEDYYLVTSTFEYFPGVPIFHSHDLVHWRQIGHCLTRASQVPLTNSSGFTGIYAPTIRHHAGVFYMVTTNVAGGGHFYVYTDDPAGEWSEPVWVDAGLGDSIDPSLFFDDDGTVYFTCTGPNQQLFQFEIDIKTGQRLAEPRMVFAGTGGKYTEAPHLYKINNLYYLMFAEGGTEYGHFETIARSESPWGPFELCPHHPILTHRSTDLPIQATGHADLIQAHDDSWWLVFLAIRPQGYPPCYHLGRETFLAPVQWDDAGWPAVGDNGQTALSVNAPCLPAHPWQKPDCRTEFDQPALDFVWNYLCNPIPENYSLAARPGWLRLHGTDLTLDDGGSPTFVGRRQQHFDCVVRTRLYFTPEKPGEEAGLTVFMNNQHHYEIALTGEKRVIVRRRIGSLAAIVAEMAWEGDDILLQIDAQTATYTFSAGSTLETIQPVATGETRYLSTEVAGGFTGVYFGLYATGNGQPCQTPADFDWFEYIWTGD